MPSSPWVEANTEGSVAGSRPAAWHAASATSSATATVSGARRRSFGASSCGEGRAGAAEGVPALVEAAREHRIDELLIRTDGPDAHREVWIGEDPDQLAVRRTDLKVLGEQHSWPARADDALIRSAVATDAPALSVAEREVPVGGLGALLRWK